jgi:hypothetical protein
MFARVGKCVCVCVCVLRIAYYVFVNFPSFFMTMRKFSPISDDNGYHGIVDKRVWSAKIPEQSD